MRHDQRLVFINGLLILIILVNMLFELQDHHDEMPSILSTSYEYLLVKMIYSRFVSIKMGIDVNKPQKCTSKKMVAFR